MQSSPHKPFGRLCPNQFGLAVILLSEFTDADPNALASFDALILDQADPDARALFLRNLRSSEFTAVYLKPVFLLSGSSGQQEFVSQLADGVLPAADIGPMALKVQQINRRIKQLNPDTPGSSNPLLEKMLRYLFTREVSLSPVMDLTSPHGYAYPVLLPAASTTQGKDMVEAIESGLESGYLLREFQDRLHLCPHCYHAFLNFRETCPDCHSADLTQEDVIHHFVCAYIGPESDFYRNEELHCPKCNRFLKHIGVDYDKPSQVFSCRNCQSVFQEPKMKVLCFHCRKESEPALLKAFDIGNLQLTEKGRSGAVLGVYNSEPAAYTEQGLVPLELFELFVQHETDRQKVTPSSCAAGTLHISFGEEPGADSEKDFPKIMQEIAELVRLNLKQPNLVSLLPGTGTVLILFPEISQETAAPVMEGFRKEINKLLKNNLPGKKPKVIAETIAIGPESSRQEVMDALLNRETVK